MSDIRLLIERYVNCYNRMDVEAMLECVSDDVLFENISNSGQSMSFQGRDAMREVAMLGLQAFSYRQQKVVRLICAETSAAAEVEFTGTAALDLPMGAKAGDVVKLRGVSIFEMQNGVLSRVADYS